MSSSTSALISRPTPGVYAIVNMALSPDDESLAITFNGENQTVTVNAVNFTDSTQSWTIEDWDSTTQSVSPTNNTDLQAAWGSDVVTVLPAGNYVWTINNTDSGFTIQDGGETVFWGLDSAVEGAEVTIGTGTGDEKQRWLFESLA